MWERGCGVGERAFDALGGGDVAHRLAALEGLRGDVRRFVRRLGADAWTADDVVAETFVVAWRRLDRVPATPEDARSWLCGVARNVLRNVERAERRRWRLLARVGAHDALRSVVPDGSADRILQVEGWRALPHADRLVLWLTAVHGWGPQELSTALGCSRAAAKTRLSRAREKLRRAISR